MKKMNSTINKIFDDFGKKFYDLKLDLDSLNNSKTLTDNLNVDNLNKLLSDVNKLEMDIKLVDKKSTESIELLTKYKKLMDDIITQLVKSLITKLNDKFNILNEKTDKMQEFSNLLSDEISVVVSMANHNFENINAQQLQIEGLENQISDLNIPLTFNSIATSLSDILKLIKDTKKGLEDSDKIIASDLTKLTDLDISTRLDKIEKNISTLQQSKSNINYYPTKEDYLPGTFVGLDLDFDGYRLKKFINQDTTPYVGIVPGEPLKNNHNNFLLNGTIPVVTKGSVSIQMVTSNAEDKLDEGKNNPILSPKDDTTIIGYNVSNVYKSIDNIYWVDIILLG